MKHSNLCTILTLARQDYMCDVGCTCHRGEVGHIAGMQVMLEELRLVLEEYDAAIRLQKSEGAPDLVGIFRKLDAAGGRLDVSVHPQLRHYMESKSYRKAYDFVFGNDGVIQRGSCGR